MEKIIDKVSSYNILNNLFPGVILCFLISKGTAYSYLFNNNILENLFIYYFVGVIISRFGSLVIEPLCKKLKIVEFAPYKQFVLASIKDSKIDIISETNNTYRSFLSMLVIYGIIIGWVELAKIWPLFNVVQVYLLIIILIALFVLSYAKQTKYVKSRVEAHVDHDEVLRR